MNYKPPTPQEMSRHLINRMVAEEIEARSRYTAAYAEARASGFRAERTPYTYRQEAMDKKADNLFAQMEDAENLRKFVVKHFTQYVVE